MQATGRTGCTSHARWVLVGLTLALEWKMQNGIAAAINSGRVGFARRRRLQDKAAMAKVLVESLGTLQLFNQAYSRVS